MVQWKVSAIATLGLWVQVMLKKHRKHERGWKKNWKVEKTTDFDFFSFNSPKFVHSF